MNWMKCLPHHTMTLSKATKKELSLSLPFRFILWFAEKNQIYPQKAISKGGFKTQILEFSKTKEFQETNKFNKTRVAQKLTFILKLILLPAMDRTFTRTFWPL